jgi:pyrimidine operon attenuation protein/uracil phosphoribosyltransferase
LKKQTIRLTFEVPNRFAIVKILLDQYQLDITLQRLAHELVENHLSFEQTAIIGLQPRGIWLSDRIVKHLQRITGNTNIAYGKLDITFYRDDVHDKSTIHIPAATDINFSVSKKKVILVDDVLHTGRTIRAAMDALLDFGRPAQIELLTLIDRHFSRELPVQPDYVGRTIDTIITQKVKVSWAENDGKDEVVLID